MFHTMKYTPNYYYGNVVTQVRIIT